MNEQEMERIFRLQEPEELEIRVNPWGTAMGRILWGLGLTTLTPSMAHRRSYTKSRCLHTRPVGTT